mmetsp:Transcript_80522/g.224040  ORF Transcript_80522/g.224040 Transcript_80522/m.224040 type:complete len:263 (-) Transcript_80522:695-1483(-)
MTCGGRSRCHCARNSAACQTASALDLQAAVEKRGAMPRLRRCGGQQKGCGDCPYWRLVLCCCGRSHGSAMPEMGLRLGRWSGGPESKRRPRLRAWRARDGDTSGTEWTRALFWPSARGRQRERHGSTSEGAALRLPCGYPPGTRCKSLRLVGYPGVGPACSLLEHPPAQQTKSSALASASPPWLTGPRARQWRAKCLLPRGWSALRLHEVPPHCARRTGTGGARFPLVTERRGCLAVPRRSRRGGCQAHARRHYLKTRPRSR